MAASGLAAQRASQHREASVQLEVPVGASHGTVRRMIYGWIAEQYAEVERRALEAGDQVNAELAREHRAEMRANNPDLLITPDGAHADQVRPVPPEHR